VFVGIGVDVAEISEVGVFNSGTGLPAVVALAINPGCVGTAVGLASGARLGRLHAKLAISKSTNGIHM
jgi:hypothetical protein